MSFKDKLLTDSYLPGIIAGIVLPVLTALIVLPLGWLSQKYFAHLVFFDSRLFLLLIIPNLLFMRYLVIKASLEKPGKAIMVVTALLIIAYFMFVHKHPFNLPL